MGSYVCAYVCVQREVSLYRSTLPNTTYPPIPHPRNHLYPIPIPNQTSSSPTHTNVNDFRALLVV